MDLLKKDILNNYFNKTYRVLPTVNWFYLYSCTVIVNIPEFKKGILKDYNWFLTL